MQIYILKIRNRLWIDKNLSIHKNIKYIAVSAKILHHWLTHVVYIYSKIKYC